MRSLLSGLRFHAQIGLEQFQIVLGGQLDVLLRARGKVQGVGFRWWCAGTAKPMGLTGYAENLDDGRVKVVAEGTAASCARLVDVLG